MIETVGIIGAGTMGNGIAQICAAAGLQVVMVDISDAAVSRAWRPSAAASTVSSRRRR
jgi:3-hydroxybutyryl-CoA dehydrogenase